MQNNKYHGGAHGTKDSFMFCLLWYQIKINTMGKLIHVVNKNYLYICYRIHISPRIIVMCMDCNFKFLSGALNERRMPS